MSDSSKLKEARKARTASFFKKGILIALFSGLLYGFYSAFIVAATSCRNSLCAEIHKIFQTIYLNERISF